MARPLKKGLDYFALDVSFYRDIKIRKLIRRKGGEALSVYIILLCMIYDDGYYIAWDEDLSFVISEVTTFDEVHINDIIQYCVEIDLFDKNLFANDKILTSRGLQKRYMTACSLTKRKISNNLPYMLLYVNDKDDNNKLEVNSINAEEKSINTEETQENSVLSTQRKEKKNKDNNSLRSSLSSSSTTTSCVRNFVETSESSVDVKNVIEELKSDRGWLLSMQRRHGIETKKIVGWLNAFVVECNCRGSRMHEDKSDVMRHFNDWLMIQRKNKRGDKGNEKKTLLSTAKENFIRAKAELCSTISAEQSAVSFDLIEFRSFENNKLSVFVPSEDVINILETKPYIDYLRNIFYKFFGIGVKLDYYLKEKIS